MNEDVFPIETGGFSSQSCWFYTSVPQRNQPVGLFMVEVSHYSRKFDSVEPSINSRAVDDMAFNSGLGIIGQSCHFC